MDKSCLCLSVPPLSLATDCSSSGPPPQCFWLPGSFPSTFLRARWSLLVSSFRRGTSPRPRACLHPAALWGTPKQPPLHPPHSPMCAARSPSPSHPLQAANTCRTPQHPPTSLPSLLLPHFRSQLSRFPPPILTSQLLALHLCSCSGLCYRIWQNVLGFSLLSVPRCGHHCIPKHLGFPLHVLQLLPPSPPINKGGF